MLDNAVWNPVHNVVQQSQSHICILQLKLIQINMAMMLMSKFRTCKNHSGYLDVWAGHGSSCWCRAVTACLYSAFCAIASWQAGSCIWFATSMSCVLRAKAEPG